MRRRVVLCATIVGLEGQEWLNSNACLPRVNTTDSGFPSDPSNLRIRETKVNLLFSSFSFFSISILVPRVMANTFASAAEIYEIKYIKTKVEINGNWWNEISKEYVVFHTILQNESNLFDFARGWIFVTYSCWFEGDRDWTDIGCINLEKWQIQALCTFIQVADP